MSVSLVDGHIDNDTPGMTDNEIIKALERCTGYPSCPTDCPLYEQPMDCLLKLSKPTLDLINRQKAEIERLEEEKEELRASIEMFTEIGKMYSELKADAIKEFAERLKDYYIKDKRYKRPHASTMIIFLFDLIDKLVKEMVGAESG